MVANFKCQPDKVTGYRVILLNITVGLCLMSVSSWNDPFSQNTVEQITLPITSRSYAIHPWLALNETAGKWSIHLLCGSLRPRHWSLFSHLESDWTLQGQPSRFSQAFGLRLETMPWCSGVSNLLTEDPGMFSFSTVVNLLPQYLEGDYTPVSY